MSTAETLILGAVAGLTIFVGLPMGRIRSTNPATRASLTAVATGILVFLFWDVVTHGVDPVETRLTAHAWGAFAGYAALLGFGFAAGLMTLTYYDGWLKSRRATPLVGPGAAAVDEFEHRTWLESLTPGRRLALLIATGIGLHNFGEGLAIGQSAAAGELSLALVLIIGFGLHNATEGFGIVGPMAGAGERPTWGYLAVLGIIGGGPTFLGTLIGQSFVNDFMYMSFLALAAGSILYVVVQLVKVGFKLGHEDMLVWGLFLGFAVGLATELFIEAVQI